MKTTGKMTTRKRNRDVKYMQYHKCMQTFVTFLGRVTGDEKNGTYSGMSSRVSCLCNPSTGVCLHKHEALVITVFNII